VNGLPRAKKASAVELRWPKARAGQSAPAFRLLSGQITVLDEILLLLLISRRQLEQARRACLPGRCVFLTGAALPE
jgi:hypothetical protein